VDLNGDGKLDLLSGSYSVFKSPMMGLFYVMAPNGQGGFEKPESLKGSDQKVLNIPVANKSERQRSICTRPTAVDWDGDGQLDLVVGNFEGSFFVFHGEGKGQFKPIPDAIKVDGKILRIENAHSDPFVVDWDGDGDLDILSGSSRGGVQWSENTAGKGKVPVLTAFQILIPFPDGRQLSNEEQYRKVEPTGPSGSTRVWVDDINGDGKLDILLGDSRRSSYAVKGLSEDEFKKKNAAWHKEMNTIQREMENLAKQGKGASVEISKKMTAHVHAHKKILQSDSFGHVWLFLQS